MSATTAFARNVPRHYGDLAGLALQADAIVEADRTPNGSGAASYRVTRTIRGNIAPGVELRLDDGEYDTASIDKHVVVFLDRVDGAGAFIVPSGLRVTLGGRVFRYEGAARSNDYHRVPQGRDPVDVWQSGVEPETLAAFEQDLNAAIARVDALPAAIAKRDRAALLALLGPASDAQAGGDFEDAFASKVLAALVQAHDSEGALLAYARDHSTYAFPSAIPIADCIAIARDTTRPVALRLSAIRAVRNHTDFYANVDAVAAMTALVADPAPEVRAAVPEIAVLHGTYDARSAAEKAAFERVTRDARAALTRQFAVETDPTALAAIAMALELYPASASLPARAGAPLLAGVAELHRDELRVTVTCLHTRAILQDAKLVAIRDGQPAEMIPWTIYERCDDRAGDSRAGQRLRLAPGRYAIAADIDVDGTRSVLALGAVVADTSGELTLVRP